MVRHPVVAGAFYPGGKMQLEQELAEMIQPIEPRRSVIGLISPHAGYIYSGFCAGKGFGQIIIPDTVIIIGVNHHGIGQPYAVDGHDAWHTPLGRVEIDSGLRDRLTKDSEIFVVDSSAGSREHSLEVQVPFIQYINPGAKILPITISSVNISTLIKGGREIAALINEFKNILMVASTDMSHYISAERAKLQDQKAIHKILQMDPEGLFNVVASERISMCGVSPTTMMLAAALCCNAQKSEIIDYTHSGVVSGDNDQVVGYLSMVVH